MAWELAELLGVPGRAVVKGADLSRSHQLPGGDSVCELCLDLELCVDLLSVKQM